MVTRSISRQLSQRTLVAERGNPVLLLSFYLGRFSVRRADSNAGIGGWKKRMLRCNGADTGLNITWHESEPTSDWSLIAREFGEPIL